MKRYLVLTLVTLALLNIISCASKYKELCQPLKEECKEKKPFLWLPNGTFWRTSND